MGQDERLTERLIALVIAAVFALNHPLLNLFSNPGLLLGIPTLYLYLFLIWALIISLIASVMERSAAPDLENDTPPDREKGPNA